jgi:hypothetical protein
MNGGFALKAEPRVCVAATWPQPRAREAIVALAFEHASVGDTVAPFMAPVEEPVNLIDLAC